MTDRLELIESRHAEAGGGHGDVAWLIAEVKRLRAQMVRLHREEELIEALAAYAHEAWSGWMKYQERAGGNAFWDDLPVELVKRWIRQANTDYAELPEDEKKSDRQEARRMLAIFNRFADQPQPEREEGNLG